MKTPIEQLISRLETLRDEAEGHTAEVEAYQRAINEATLLLEKEADRMDEAYSTGWKNALWDEQKFSS
jgi:hypothetical protein